MTRVRVTFVYEPEDEAADPSHEMGVTEEEYERMDMRLQALGAEDIEITREKGDNT